MIEMCVTRFSRRIPDSKLLYRRIPLEWINRPANALKVLDGYPNITVTR
jgi:hypothetical protein